MRCMVCNKLGHHLCNPAEQESTAKKPPLALKVEDIQNAIASGSVPDPFDVPLKPADADDGWYVDSIASYHMTNDIKVLNNFVPYTPREIIRYNQKMYSEGYGHVNLLLKGQKHALRLRKVLYVPLLIRNLISIKQMTDKGLVVTFCPKGCYITAGKDLVARASNVHKLFRLDAISLMPRKGVKLAGSTVPSREQRDGDGDGDVESDKEDTDVDNTIAF